MLETRQASAISRQVGEFAAVELLAAGNGVEDFLVVVCARFWGHVQKSFPI